MQTTTLILLLAAMAMASFYLGRRRSLALVGGPAHGSSLHSLPGYYGYFTLLWCVLPALGLLLAWLFLEPMLIVALVIRSLPDAQQSLSAGELNLLVNNIQNLAAGDAVMLGDTLHTDIAGAAGVGIASALLLTGVTTQAHVDAAVARGDGRQVPTYVVRGLIKTA